MRRSRSRFRTSHLPDQFMIKTAVGPILVYTVEEYFSCAKQLTGLGQLYRVDVASFPAAFDGALIPAFFGKKVVA